MNSKTTTGARRAFVLGVLRLHHPAAIPPHAVMPRPCYMAGPGDDDDDGGDDTDILQDFAGEGRPLCRNHSTFFMLENELRGVPKR